MYPMEPAAGMDIVKLREHVRHAAGLHGRASTSTCSAGSQEEIVAELEYKIPPMVRTGGCVLGLDHRIPNGTPLENYRFYVQKAWEILDREAAQIVGQASSLSRQPASHRAGQGPVLPVHKEVENGEKDQGVHRPRFASRSTGGGG